MFVELEKSPKPIASCAMPAAEGMKIKTNTPFVEKARKGVMEFLLQIIHWIVQFVIKVESVICKINQCIMVLDKSRFKENKRQVKDKYMGPLNKNSNDKMYSLYKMCKVCN